MIAGLKLILRHRHLLWETTLTDIRGRYAGTVLGMAWIVLYPLLFLGLYAVVYMLILKVRIAGLSDAEQVLLIFAGLIPFLGFAEALGAGTGSVLSNKGVIKNTVFPIELIPVKSVLAGSLTMLISLLLLQGVLWLRGTIFLSQLLTPVVLILQLLFTVGVIWPLSALNVLIRDLGQFMSVCVLFLMLVSPIGYTVDMVPAGLAPLLYVNPLHYLIALYRGCIIGGRVELPSLLAFAAIAVIVFWIGYHLFNRFKEILADHV